MPLYDYVCRSHGRFEIWHEVPKRRTPRRCLRCHALSRPIISDTITVSGFRPYVEWNIDASGPVPISSARQLDRECKARNLEVKGGGGESRLAQRHLEDYHARVHKAIDSKR
jgi:hypothetical protein